MSWDTFIDLLIALVAGKSDIVPAALTNPTVLLILFTATLLSIAVAMAKNQHYKLMLLSLACAAALAFTFHSQQASSFDLHAGRVFIGGDLTAPDGATNVSFDDCQKRCSSDPRCAAFTYDQTSERCYLKGSITTMHEFASAISGIKRSSPIAAAAR